MIEDGRSAGEPRRRRKGGMPYVIIRAMYYPYSSGPPGETPKQEFWNNYMREISRDSSISRDRTPDQLERQVKDIFPLRLAERFKDSLRQAYPASRAKDESTIRRRERALEGIKFSVGEIWYSSINIETLIDHADELIDAFGMTVDAFTAVLSSCAPGALYDVLGDNHRLSWQVEIPDRNLPDDAPDDEAKGPLGRWFGRFSSPTFVWRLLNALWILPILVSLTVLILAYREMNRITELHDADRAKLLSDEIARVAARSDRFDERQDRLLQRHENALKDTTEAIRTILSDEIKRVAARSDYFDQQQAVLLQRYENQSRETTEILKTLIQKSDACCKSCDGDSRKPKDRCRKSLDAK
ncbi:hypothetical protein [uncultured Bradyrhizobium sp.]|jgi:hypothetical protein|uniref:hypothetical protein n=1 Tax=uncultured Bradyrhizobium sp. TaxID=199684 RepID=UPI002634BBB2|nr:hypothetical protein [uncultured Bradyrhizobium sp.]